MEPRDHETAIDRLPAEIMCHIIGALSDKDYWSARLAHRCFLVPESTQALDRRRRNRWLRASPERACAAGRIDVVTFLYDRKRIPATINLTDAALKSGDVDMVRLVRQRSALWSDTRAALTAAAQGRTNLFHYLLGEVPDVAKIIPEALRLAAAHNRLDTTMSLAPMATVDARRQALQAASSHNDVQIVGFLLDCDPRLDVWDALDKAMGSLDVTRLLLERAPDLDVRPLLDGGRSSSSPLPLTAEVAQLLYDRCPGHPLQHLLERTYHMSVAQFACDTDPTVNIQQALEKAAAKRNFDMVRFLYAKKQDIDLGPAIEYAATQGRTEAVAVLYHLAPSADLLRRALSVVQGPSATYKLRNVCSTIKTMPAHD
ncbi:Ankyrin repeat domain containing protein [Pandoravirus macleodensis]|uniref:Ankyrin repeat domain containing protein n=1 Tax=Pandoravirus macleodensis TaxID=2107707 RepID=A0A2U7UGJ8_9VIRU|nr:Ankyrin repeat domain containing protein [Pandoravirus macleodensis]AVK77131.1 Ankyrin repeat domain containing protein [Pandoravirus macleodensis]UMO79841.1 Ankyrin repeat domain containing protein [Pandoravirus aubagnensis]